MQRTYFLALAFTAALLAACSNYDTRLTSSATRYLGQDGSIISRSSQSTLAEKNSYWDGDGVSGPASVVVDLSEQKAMFYRGGKLVGVSAISTGREGYATPTGSYKILEKKLDYASNLYGDYVDASGNVVVRNVCWKTDPKPPGATFRGAPMPYWMRLTSAGVGMHQGFLPGVPDSHGCIRMPEKMVKIFFANVEVGTPVKVVN